MKKNKNDEKELEEFRKLIEHTSEKDFDGHTEFLNFSAREKLEWLSELIYFTHQASKLKK